MGEIEVEESIAQKVRTAGGWLPFDQFMQLALYAPNLGYYTNASRKFGATPCSGSDFVTAPELSALFGQTLAAQVNQALDATETEAIWEFGAGTGALAEQLLNALDTLRGPKAAALRYTIVDLSGSLRARQQARLARFGARVQWANALPEHMHGVLLGNEVLDAMPCKLLARLGGVWHERGVTTARSSGLPRGVTTARSSELPRGVTTARSYELPRGVTTARSSELFRGASVHEGQFTWADQPTDLRPPLAIEGDHDYLTEIHPQADAFIRTVAGKLQKGAAFFIDYGFPEAEYYHPQRHMGTLMCHQQHRMDGNPLVQVGEKDITAHINFTGIALAAQEVGLGVLGYTSQARFLMNCGLLQIMEHAALAERAQAQKLITEHEMGELFKVIGFFKGAPWEAMGFAQGDRTHTL